MTFEQFCKEQGEWSQKTFGADAERGPKGPLLHLQKEVIECLSEIEQGNTYTPKLDMEIVDCFFLVIDAARRNGMRPSRLLRVAEEKLKINKARQWQRSIGDVPIEHVREGK
jgi:hypothetical protein